MKGPLNNNTYSCVSYKVIQMNSFILLMMRPSWRPTLQSLLLRGLHLYQKGLDIEWNPLQHLIEKDSRRPSQPEKCETKRFEYNRSDLQTLNVWEISHG